MSTPVMGMEFSEHIATLGMEIESTEGTKELNEVRKALEALAAIANLKRMALNSRKQGNINVALDLEKGIQAEYDQLPPECKW